MPEGDEEEDDEEEVEDDDPAMGGKPSVQTPTPFRVRLLLPLAGTGVRKQGEATTGISDSSTFSVLSFGILSKVPVG